MLTQPIHPRDIHELICAHHRAKHARLGGKRVLVQNMAGKQHAMFMTPVLNGKEKVFIKQFLKQLHVLPLNRAAFFPVFLQKQLRKMRGQIVSEPI